MSIDDRYRFRFRGLARATTLSLALVVAAAFGGCSGDSDPVPGGAESGDTGEVDNEDSASVEAESEEGAAADVGPVAEPVRHPASERMIYFVMPDRFDNGDPGNDTGGVEGGPLDHGFLPQNIGYHQGGDLIGLTERLDYLEELGVGAIWITPPFTNNTVQGDGTIDGSSTSYHGYWQIDWTAIDPHLGSEQQMQDFIAAAHDRDMLVFFDIVVNHTGDVIGYAGDEYGYVSTSAQPWLDADGTPFDPADLAGEDDFPTLDAETSFPRLPVVDGPAVKKPEWLNDVTLYHNRGNSTFSGESSLYGDFFGLDDLFTENPRVRDGMIDIHTGLIERYGIDGFRIDTMKHVNTEFWRSFAPAMTEAADVAGHPDFFFFGEVAGEDPILQSSYTNIGVPATLDFVVSGALDRYVGGRGNGSLLADAFDNDDWFTDADNNASMQVTFFGNHDQGRMGYLIDRANPSADEDELLARMMLGNDLLFLVRGVPVVYYGDEQGFVGTGGDRLARQSMFPSLAPEHQDDDNIGSDATPADDNFDPDHPLYRQIAELARFRGDHPALLRGAQILHETDGPVFAFSRIDRDERTEYVVLANSNGSLAVPARFPVLSASTTFEQLRGPDVGPVESDAGGEILVEVPPTSSVVLRASTPLELPQDAPTVTLVRPEGGGEIPTARYRLEAAVGPDLGRPGYAEVTFAVSVDGGEPEIVGTDDAAPYRVYWANDHIDAGASVEITATVDDGSGRLASDRVAVTMGDRS